MYIPCPPYILETLFAPLAIFSVLMCDIVTVYIYTEQLTLINTKQLLSRDSPQIAKLAKDLKNKFVFPSPSHSPAHTQPLANAQPSTTTPTIATPAAKPTNLSDMKSELFGGSTRKEKAPETKRGEFSGVEEGEGGRGGGGSSGRMEGEPIVTGDQLAEGEEEKEEEEEEEEDNTYGGMLT